MRLSLNRLDHGRRFRLRRSIDGSVETIHSLLFEPDHWTLWGPFLTDVDCSASRVSTGTEGRVQLLGVLWLPFRVLDATETAWRWSVAGAVPPADGHRVERRDDGSVSVSFELPLWAPWYLPVCYRALSNIDRIAGRQSR